MIIANVQQLMTAVDPIDVSKTTTGNSAAPRTAECYQVELYIFGARTLHTAAGVCEKVGRCRD